MERIKSNISTVALSVNELNIHRKDKRLSGWIEKPNSNV